MSRRLAAILAADVDGYSRLMSADEAGTLKALQSCLSEVVEPAVTDHDGRIVKLMGDGVLAEFPSAVQAVSCAAAIQDRMTDRSTANDRRIRFRIGVNLGDIIADGDDIFGGGVNIAARLEGLTEPGGICVSGTVYNHTRNKVEVGFDYLGTKTLKNIDEPVMVYRVVPKSQGISSETKRDGVPRLKRVAALSASVALIAAAGGLLWLQPWTASYEAASVEAMAFPLPDRPSIAVLPFNNMSEDASQEYFADGMTEDLITDLSKISGLFVIARNSSFTYKDRAVKVPQVAEELGVRYVLEGSVRRAGDQVRINAQLIDATTGGHMWAERYDGRLDDVFKLQDEVTGAIIAALSVTLTGEEQAQAARHETDSAAAHDSYLQGWAQYKLRTPEALARATLFFEEAIRLDPDYAQAHAALASTYWDAYQNDWAFDMGLASFQAEEKANAHLEAALAAPTPLAHALQARIMASFGLNDHAVTEAEKAVALGRNDAASHAGLAEALIFADRPGEALDAIKTAMRLDPHHPPDYLITHGAAQFGMEQYDNAATTFERAVKRNPDTEFPLIYLASTYAHLGRLTEAEATIETANDLRARHGQGDLSLEPAGVSGYSPFTGEIEFNRFGGAAAQQRLRAGLSVIPALSWQYLVKVTVVQNAENKRVPLVEIVGATEIDLATAKAFHDRGILFIDQSREPAWRNAHIPGAIHLPFARDYDDPSKPRLTQPTLRDVADPANEIVFYHYFDADFNTPWAPAKALSWGYQKVYYFVGGAPAWKAAGYPIETKE